MGFLKKLFRSKTNVGALLAAGAYIAADHKNPQRWAEGIGGFMTVFGARDAMNKGGTY